MHISYIPYIILGRIKSMKKIIRFNYFEPTIVDIENGSTALWEVEPMLQYISINYPNWEHQVGGECVEVEPSSVMQREISLYGIQFSKLRITNVPSKKKIGRPKVAINLDDDEYIGEFVTCIYDSRLKILGIQSNKYGLTIAQIAEYLTYLRVQYLTAHGRDPGRCLIELKPVVDPNAFERTMNSEFLRKIEFTTANYMIDSTLAENPLLGSARQLINQYEGATITITVSVNQHDRKGTLNRNLSHETLQTIKSFRESVELSQEGNPNVRLEVTQKENDSAKSEIINLISPIVSHIVTADIPPRTTIAHEYLFSLIADYYWEKRHRFIQILHR